MSEEIVPQVFENSEFGKLRVTQDENGEPWFVASDIAKALGYRDAEKMTRRLDDDEKGTRSVGTPGGEQQMTVITEAGMYSAILGSKVDGAKRFKRWVTHDVLPAIRRDGGYMVARDGETPQETMARALLIAQETIDRKDSTIAAQQDTIRELAPKAAFYDAVGDSDGKMSVADFSKALRQAGIHMGQNRLFTWFRDNGYMGKRGVHRNRPTQKTIEQGLFYLHDNTFVDHDGKVFTSFTPMITPKGATFFFKRITHQRQMRLPA
jgi:anti-repressor protein